MATTVPAPADTLTLALDAAGLDPAQARALTTAHTAHHARLSTPDAGTQCPVHHWCIVNHTDRHEGDNYHYSALTHTGPHAHALEILATGQGVISLYAAGETEYLDLDELDALIAALLARRPELAALTAQLTQAGTR